MTKKKATTKKTATRRPSVRERAQQIIGNPKDYDYDTRKTIEAALTDKRLKRRDLTAMVREAEKGELVEHPIHDCFEHDHRGTAHRTIQFLESGLPDWLLQGTVWLINAVAAEFNIKVLPDDGEGNYSAKALGDLFRVSGLYQFDYLPDIDLAQMIERVLEHPDCPQELADGINDFTHNLFNRLNEGDRRVYLTAPYIRALLLEAKVQEGGEGR